MKKKNIQEPTPDIEEWDLSQDMGIFPKDISLTQNIGCVGGKSKKVGNKPTNDKEKS